MVELTSKDRLQPSLLDRLLDQEPEKISESLEARALTRPQLRAAVLRDLSWLLNAVRQEPDEKSSMQAEVANWRDADLARRSVLNFGLPAFSGFSISSMNSGAVERSVAEAIRTFEPRLDPKTVVVELLPSDGNHHNTMRLVIRAQMWSQPVPLDLLLSAAMDAETGATHVRELRA